MLNVRILKSRQSVFTEVRAPVGTGALEIKECAYPPLPTLTEKEGFPEITYAHGLAEVI